MEDMTKQLVTLATIGAALTAGKELDKVEDLKKEWKHLVSKLIVGSGLAMAAASLWLFFPTAHFMAIAGAAAGIVILGEKFIMRWIEKRYFKDPV